MRLQDEPLTSLTPAEATAAAETDHRVSPTRIMAVDSQIARRMNTLIIGRLLIIFMLLVAGWVWNNELMSLDAADFARALFFICTGSIGTTLIYFFLSQISTNYVFQFRLQFTLDLLVTNFLVWRTGDITSPYIPLYIVVICAVSVFLGGRGTAIVVGCSAMSFALISLLAAEGSIPSFSNGYASGGKVLQIVGFHVLVFLIVGTLASRLSDRLASGEQLRETARDLRDLRMLHKRVVESIRSGLVTTDLEGNIFTFNDAASDITGLTASEMVGKSVFPLLGNPELQTSESLKAALASGLHPSRMETDLFTPSGGMVHIGYGISPLFKARGELTGWIISFQDLTDVKLMEENLRRSERLAALGRLSAALAHEIRNPLGAMRGAIQVLQSSMPADSAQSTLMGIILRESDRLNGTITGFLNYARPRPTEFKPTDIRHALSDTCALLEHSPDLKETHRFEYHLPADPVILLADASQIKQIFWNLTRNALQAMPDGGYLHIRMERLERRRVRILFEDTGCGMPPEHIEQLFEPFSVSTTGGTGLGLSIVYQIVSDHKGTIAVTSKVGAGTRFTIEFPNETNPPASSLIHQTLSANSPPKSVEGGSGAIGGGGSHAVTVSE